MPLKMHPQNLIENPFIPYSFQGQEHDDEVKGEGNSVNYKFRMCDPRVGRFFAVDPLESKYPYNGSYNFSENRVIDGAELEGSEWEIRTITYPNQKPYLEVERNDDIPMGYYRLVMIRKSATENGNDDTGGGSDVKGRLVKFQTPNIRFGLGGFSQSQHTLASDIVFSQSANVSDFINEEIQKATKTLSENSQGINVEGSGKIEQTVGSNIVKNPQTFEIKGTASGIASFTNFTLDKENSLISITAADIESPFVQELNEKLLSQGYKVELIDAPETFEGGIKTNDSNNNGIKIHLDLTYKSDLKVTREKTEITEVELTTE